MTSFSTQAKSSSTSNNDTKHSSSFQPQIRHGKAAAIGQIGDHAMDAPDVFSDQELLDQTFDQMADQPYQNDTKH